MLKSTVKQYEESTGKIAGAYFFNGKEYGRGSKILYPNFKEMDFKIGVAFMKDASSFEAWKKYRLQYGDRRMPEYFHA